MAKNDKSGTSGTNSHTIPGMLTKPTSVESSSTGQVGTAPFRNTSSAAWK